MPLLEVTNVSVRLKLTREIKPGTFKSVELGAQALITPDEEGDWQQAQRELYAALKSQLNALWNGSSTNGGTI